MTENYLPTFLILPTCSYLLTLFLEVLAKATNHYTYLMSPKFLGNVICCAQPPNAMTLARKQYLNVTKKITCQPFLSWEILTLFLEVFAKATNYYTYLMNPKFLVNVICCARAPDSLTLARKQCLNVTKNYLPTFLILRNLDLIPRGSCKGHKLLHVPNEPKISG